MISCTINGKQVTAPEGATIMEAAELNNIHIPNLCYLKDVHKFGACRICVVEVEGNRNLMASCLVQAKEGMVIRTNTAKLREIRKTLYQLTLSDHPKDCLSCPRNQSCELQSLGAELGVNEAKYEGEMTKPILDQSSPSITRDQSKCILCRRCVTVCNQIQGVGALNAQHRGFHTIISPAMELPLAAGNCTNCGQCTVVCPVACLEEHDATDAVWQALADPTKKVIVQTAPAIRVAIGEELGDPPGTRVTGKLAAALRAMNFDYVFDTNFAADLTILEEGTEFLGRVAKALTGDGAVLPIISSCSPGWVKFVEHAFPDQLAHLSTCKSPHTMMGALVKSFFAKKQGIDPKDMFVVSIMPCTAKKFEIGREEMQNDGYKNVDAVLTTRELARMIKGSGIYWPTLEESDFDSPLGLSTGAADIFGVTGGVMEAALRTVYELVTGRELPFEGLHVTPIVGFERIKEASFTIEKPLPQYSFLDGVTVKVAVTSGFVGARALLEQVKDGTSPYHFIEIMGCPGGCISGGGQPRKVDSGIRELRLKATYAEDESKTMRKSHENPAVQKLYAEFLGEPNGHLSHELLHTHYVKRGKYNQYLENEDC